MNDLEVRMEAGMKLRNFRPTTQRNYRDYVRLFGEHFERSPAALGAEEVWSYLVYLRDERKLSPITLRGHIAALRFLYRVVLDRPEVVRAFPLPRVPRKLPEILSGAEVEQILASVHNIKYRAILMTTYGAGLRIGETCALHISDIDSKRMLIHIRDGKGGAERYAMLSQRLLLALREYYKQTRPPGPYLFPGQVGTGHISHDAVGKVLHGVVVQAGLSKRVTPHILRHSFATHLLDLGTDIRVIQVLLGHRRIETTLRYAQVSVRQVGRTQSPLDLLGTKKAEVLG